MGRPNCGGVSVIGVVGARQISTQPSSAGAHTPLLIGVEISLDGVVADPREPVSARVRVGQTAVELRQESRQFPFKRVGGVGDDEAAAVHRLAALGARQQHLGAQQSRRQAGKVEGFHYSQLLANADFVWDDARLDAWLTNPQAVIPGAIMTYRQAKPETRAAIIAYLKELN